MNKLQISFRRKTTSFFSSICILLLCSSIFAQDYPKLKLVPNQEYTGQNIARTMKLLAESTPAKKNNVKILFYGQSITEQAWTKQVAKDLKERFPNANLTIENRAIGGFASQLLVKTAETDLYPFYPDLVIFHVYGSHTEYENIMKAIRQKTTAEILMQNDHFAENDKIDEETDAKKVTMKSWTPWMNYQFLPNMAKKYQAELVNQRENWKEYLKENQFTTKKLLVDAVHLNAHGEYLMAEIVKAHLKYDKDAKSPLEAQVKSIPVSELKQENGMLQFKFIGNRIDVVGKAGISHAVLIDGIKPSQHPNQIAKTRTTSYPNSNWPCLLKTTSTVDAIPQDWTLTMTEIAGDLKSCIFKLKGSVTGEDGEGVTNQKFISKSGQVVILPEDWNLEYAFKVTKKILPANYEIKWKVFSTAKDRIELKQSPAGQETTDTIAINLENKEHVMTIPAEGISFLRIYTPLLKP